ncbi:hypothetical protein P7C70_g4410, partial [Phenoliferia sp. Uapishka_3]
MVSRTERDPFFMQIFNAHVSSAALACLPHFFPLVVNFSPSLAAHTSTPDSAPSQPHIAHILKLAFVALLPLDKLGDSKERVRELARDGMVAAGRTALALGVSAGVTPGGKEKDGPWGYLARTVQESGFASKNARAREQAPLKPFTPLLLPLLADADPGVRSLALSSVISIFSSPSVSSAARADLKKALIRHDVSKKLQDTILAAVIGGAGIPLERSSSAGSGLSDLGSNTAAGHGGSSQKGSSEAGSELSGTAAKPRISSSSTSSGVIRGSSSRPRLTPTAGRSATASVVPSLLASLPAAAFPGDPAAVHEPTTDVEAIYIASERDLQGEFEAMRAGFEGKETEHNWMVRDRSVARIRGMLKGKAHETFLDGFLASVKSVQEGILKTASSLRTTVATNALALIAELSQSLGHSFDPLLEAFLSHCLGMAGQTKKLVATASQAACKALITNSAYHLKTIQLLWTGMNDKIVLARTFVSGHVHTFIIVHGRASKSHIESSGGLEALEQCIKKGLTDANTLVKENSRATYWDYHQIWPKMADRLLAGLDATTKKQLDKADPRKGGAAIAAPAKIARPSVRSFIAQAKAAPRALSPTPPSPAVPTRTTPEPSTPSRVGNPSMPAIHQQFSSSPTTPTRKSTPSRSLPPAPVPPDSTSLSSTSPTSRPIYIATSEPLPPALPEESNDLMQLSSPFVRDDLDSSLDFDAPVSALPSPRRSPLPRPRRNPAPIIEPIVDAALRSQADQAEQAAQRLLELAESDAEDSEGSSGQVIGPGGHLIERSLPESTTASLPHFHRTPVTTRRHDVFEDSPDVRDSGLGGMGNWWMKKVEALPSAEPLAPDSTERTEEIASLVSAMQSGQVTIEGLRKISTLSRERPLREEDDGSSVLASPTRVDGPAEFGATSFWEGGRTFSRVFDGLAKLLQKETAPERKDAALVLFKDLVENQFPAFAGEELEVFELLFKLREDTSRTTIAAVEATADVFCSRLEPLYGLGSLRSSLSTYLGNLGGAKDAKSYALGLRLISKFFERIPSEILEEELPKSKSLIKNGLNDAQSGDLRRAAVNALVAAQSVLQDEERLSILVDGLAPDQRNLLSYYHERAARKKPGV